MPPQGGLFISTLDNKSATCYNTPILINTGTMKITEVTQPSDNTLFESIDADNTTGFATEDLVKIYRSHNDQWSDPMSYDEMLSEMDAMDNMTDAEAASFLAETYKK